MGAKSGLGFCLYWFWVVDMSVIFGPQIVRGERGCSDAWRALDDL